jgi:GT2 family glycosyltransferase
MNNKNVSVIIPNLNGMEYLPKCIPSLFRAFEVYPADHEIIAVDNGSTDGSIEWLRTHYPAVKIIEMGTNTGLAGACNRGAKNAKNKILVLLNNDTFTKEDFLAPLVRHFGNDENLFGVSCRLFNWDMTTFQAGRCYLAFRRGMLIETIDRDDSYHTACPTARFSASACALDRDKYLELGGFARLHRWNDAELSYRALKRGWKIFYEPESVVYHVGMATDKKLWTDRKITSIWRKEMFYTLWRNLTDWDLMAQHVMLLPHLFVAKGVRTTLAGFLEAMKLLPQIARERRREKQFIRKTDKEVLSACQKDAAQGGC